MKHPCAVPMRNQRGQALVEFLAVALALMPLFLLIPVIAKYQDIGHATQQASRYIAFEATTRNDSVAIGWKPESQLADEARRRFFSNSDAPIKTNDTAGDFRANQNAFWRDPADRPLIERFSDVTVSFGNGDVRSASHSDGFSSATDGAPFAGTGDLLGLKAHGIYTANVSVKVANLPAGLKFYQPFDRINLSMTRSTSLVIDSWTAQSRTQVDERVGGNPALFPAGGLKAVGAPVQAAIGMIDLGQAAPKLGRLDFWDDTVPLDRLKANDQQSGAP